MIPTNSARIKVDFTHLRNLCNDKFYPLFEDHHRYLNLVGGAGSGKSVFAADKCIYRTVCEPGHRIMIIRKVARTIKESCFAELNNSIERMGLGKLFSVSLSDYKIKCLNGSELMSLGLDDVEKLKSIHRPTSAWIEEATELMPEDLKQINLRLRGQNPYYKQIILTYNPINHLHWLKLFFKTPERLKKTKSVHSTYLDNRFIDAEYIDVLNESQKTDLNWHRVYALGEWGVQEGLIYKPFIIDEYPATFDYEIAGLDFGFNNPTALVKIGIKDREVYLFESIYESGLTNADLINRMKGIGFSWAIPIYADAAEPDRIVEIQRAGFNCQPTEKGTGSVNAGISLCQSLKIHSQISNENINAEAGLYAWQQAKTGGMLDEPIKERDHAMDAMRYALFSHLGRPPMQVKSTWI